MYSQFLCQEHIKSCGHRLWVDLEYGNVYCASCGDYVYDGELMTISEQHHRWLLTTFLSNATKYFWA